MHNEAKKARDVLFAIIAYNIISDGIVNRRRMLIKLLKIGLFFERYVIMYKMIAVFRKLLLKNTTVAKCDK